MFNASVCLFVCLSVCLSETRIWLTFRSVLLEFQGVCGLLSGRPTEKLRVLSMNSLGFAEGCKKTSGIEKIQLTEKSIASGSGIQDPGPAGFFFVCEHAKVKTRRVGGVNKRNRGYYLAGCEFIERPLSSAPRSTFPILLYGG